MLFDEHGRISFSTLLNLEDKRAAEVLRAAIDRAADKVRPSDVLVAAIEHSDPGVLLVLQRALKPSATLGDVIELVNVYYPPHRGASTFNGQRDAFEANLLAALDAFDANTAGPSTVTLEALLAYVFGQLDQLGSEDKRRLTLLDIGKCGRMFHALAQEAGLAPRDFFDAHKQLLIGEFTPDGYATMQRAGELAAELGYEHILPPHLYLALLGETEGVAEHLARLQAPPDMGPAKVAEVVASAFRLGEGKGQAIALTDGKLADSTLRCLRAAQKSALLWGLERPNPAERAEPLDPPLLLMGLLEEIEPRLASVLERNPLRFSLAKMRSQLEGLLREARSETRREIAFRLPPNLLPSEDLTYLARTGRLVEAVPVAVRPQGPDLFELALRALHRRDNHHVLVTGPRGVGKTEFVRELARRISANTRSPLQRKRCLWVDCQNVAPSESRARLESVLAHVAGRNDVILCLDGLGALLKDDSGGHNKLILHAALKERRVQLISVMSDQDFEDLFASDVDALNFFTRVEVAEPDEATATEIVNKQAEHLAEKFGVAIDPAAITRAVTLSSDYMLSARLPSKAIRIMQRACEDAAYDRDYMTEHDNERKAKPVDVEAIVRIVSELTGVPQATLAGRANTASYAHDLMRIVVGQKEAVTAVANQLQLIKAGLNDFGKPAAVMLFAGLTGVGKTELAKAVARFYSASKHLQTYAMGNFVEPHSVSGIIGVPPGYVGHDQGGRLINDLNNDPYSVFLMDEAEKAHPEVWKPFLNLFDEGWIVDPRGVKAYADRAIFILTSNAGTEIITNAWRSGRRDMDAIAEEVKDHLPTVRQQPSGLPVFTPEFLARITRIVVFTPLDLAAMQGICDRIMVRLMETWQKRRDKTLSVDPELLERIAQDADAMNKAQNWRLGGRIVRKRIMDCIDIPVQQAASERDEEYRVCKHVRVRLTQPDGVTVEFLPEVPRPAIPDLRVKGTGAESEENAHPVASRVGETNEVSRPGRPER